MVPYTGVLSALRRIVHEEGLLGLYRSVIGFHSVWNHFRASFHQLQSYNEFTLLSFDLKQWSFAFFGWD